MASKVMNLRMTRTKQALINSFYYLVSKKDFEKITIADITKHAEVNRATFYSHFDDKYELLDYLLGDSATAAIQNRTKGEAKFDHDSIQQLVLAVCDYYQQPNIQCRTSYVGLVVPQMKDRMITELVNCLSESLEEIMGQNELDMYVSIFAQAIHEGAIQWVKGKSAIDKEEVAKNVALIVVGGVEMIKA